MPKISVVIITLNEEGNIGRCIDSVKGVADEVVVVDSYSTDATEEICKQKGARFIQNRFADYVDQHRFADQQARHDIILTLDADEALSEELAASILEVKNDWQYDGYRMNRLTNYCGKWIRHSGWYPDTKLRLYDRKKGSWHGMRIHERYVLEKGNEAGFLKGDILHFSYVSVSDHVLQANKFTDITALAAYEQGKRSGICRILLSPVVKFLRDYFLNLGFMDGYYGFLVCQISANATFLKYVKLRELHKRKLLPAKDGS